MRGSDCSNHSSGDQRTLQKGQPHNIDEKITEGSAERVRKQNRQPEQQLNVPTNDGVDPQATLAGIPNRQGCNQPRQKDRGAPSVT